MAAQKRSLASLPRLLAEGPAEEVKTPKRPRVREINPEEAEVGLHWACFPGFLGARATCRPLTLEEKAQYTTGGGALYSSEEACLRSCSARTLPFELQTSIMTFLPEEVGPTGSLRLTSSAMVPKHVASADFDRIVMLDDIKKLEAGQNPAKYAGKICAAIKLDKAILFSKSISAHIVKFLGEQEEEEVIKRFLPVIRCMLENPNWEISSQDRVHILAGMVNEVSDEEIAKLLNLGLLQNIHPKDAAIGLALVIDRSDDVAAMEALSRYIPAQLLASEPNYIVYLWEMAMQGFYEETLNSTEDDVKETLESTLIVWSFLDSHGYHLSFFDPSAESDLVKRLKETWFIETVMKNPSELPWKLLLFHDGIINMSWYNRNILALEIRLLNLLLSQPYYASREALEQFTIGPAFRTHLANPLVKLIMKHLHSKRD